MNCTTTHEVRSRFPVVLVLKKFAGMFRIGRDVLSGTKGENINGNLGLVTANKVEALLDARLRVEVGNHEVVRVKLRAAIGLLPSIVREGPWNTS